MSEAAHLIERDKSGSLWLIAPRRISSSSSIWNAYKIWTISSISSWNYFLSLAEIERRESWTSINLSLFLVNCWESGLLASLPQLSAGSLTAGKELNPLQHQVSVIILLLFSHLQCNAWRGLSLAAKDRKALSVCLSECSLKKSRYSCQRAPVLQSSQIVFFCLRPWISLPSSFFFWATQQRKHKIFLPFW